MDDDHFEAVHFWNIGTQWKRGFEQLKNHVHNLIGVKTPILNQPNTDKTRWVASNPNPCS